MSRRGLSGQEGADCPRGRFSQEDASGQKDAEWARALGSFSLWVHS